jgi:MFS superfamily sulfate permease-like transporter
MIKKYRGGFYPQDLLASVLVFLVALPLCIGISIAAGLPPTAGLISGVIGGVVVGSLSGCPLQISGPAAGLVTVVWEIVRQYGMAYFGEIVLLAGLIQLLLGALGVAQWFRAVSPALIQGMLAGVGVLICASQFYVMLDLTPMSQALGNLQGIPKVVAEVVITSPVRSGQDLQGIHWAALISLLTFGFLVVWNAIPGLSKWISGALVGIVVAIVTASVFSLPVHYIVIPTSVWDFEGLLNLGHLKNTIFEFPIWVSAFTIALVASAESLLTATAIDKMLVGRQLKTNYDRELNAQAIGNVCAGILGVLPITGVIVRSSANVQAGAQTRLSSVFHGLWLLFFLVLFPSVLNWIPISALATVLFYTGYKLINPKYIKALWRIGRGEVLVYLVTVVAIVMTHLLEGIIIGFVVASLKLLYELAHFKLSMVVAHPENPQSKVSVSLEGSGTFLNLPRLAQLLESIHPQSRVQIDFDRLYHLDHACVELLMHWEKEHLSQGGRVEFVHEGTSDTVGAIQKKINF